MSEGILFGIGCVVFIAVTTAVLMFGYARFNQLYNQDRVASGSRPVRADGNLEYYASSGSESEADVVPQSPA